ncbi:hypothetical protein GCM10029976_047800 [Kribbella albertanoniae]
MCQAGIEVFSLFEAFNGELENCCCQMMSLSEPLEGCGRHCVSRAAGGGSNTRGAASLEEHTILSENLTRAAQSHGQTSSLIVALPYPDDAFGQDDDGRGIGALMQKNVAWSKQLPVSEE